MGAESPISVAVVAGSDDWRLGLSARQREIMGLLADGLSNKDIGHALGLTEGTVKQHLATIFRKLGVSNRTWAAALWREQGGEEFSEKKKRQRSDAGVALVPKTRAIVTAPPRLLAAVALRLRREDLEMSKHAAGDVYASFLALCDHWGAVFGGQVETHMGGYLVGTFGYPAAHVDDVERAQRFAEAIIFEMQHRFDLRPACAMAAGMDRLIVRDGYVIDTDPLRRAVEAMLRDEGAPVDPLVRTAAGSIVRLSGAEEYGEAMRRAVHLAPFVASARQALEAKRSFWLAAEAWPPIHGKHFLDAFADANPVGARYIIRLRLSGEAAGSSRLLADQLRFQLAGQLPPDAGDKPVSWGLEYLAQAGPTLVLVYGSVDLESVHRLLSPELMARLGELPLLFLVGAQPLRGAPRLAVRPLGTFGERPMVGRVHEIVLPEDGFANAAGYPDICALIDQASDMERSILARLAHQTRATRQFVAKSVGVSLPEASHGLERLERLGLVTQSEGVVMLRDQATVQAVKTVCDVFSHRQTDL